MSLKYGTCTAYTTAPDSFWPAENCSARRLRGTEDYWSFALARGLQTMAVGVNGDKAEYALLGLGHCDVTFCEVTHCDTTKML